DGGLRVPALRAARYADGAGERGAGADAGEGAGRTAIAAGVVAARRGWVGGAALAPSPPAVGRRAPAGGHRPGIGQRAAAGAGRSRLHTRAGDPQPGAIDPGAAAVPVGGWAVRGGRPLVTWRDAVALAAKGVLRRPGRAVLTVLAVALAAALLTALLTIASTARTRVLSELTKGGPLAGIKVAAAEPDPSQVDNDNASPGPARDLDDDALARIARLE